MYKSLTHRLSNARTHRYTEKQVFQGQSNLSICPTVSNLSSLVNGVKRHSCAQGETYRRAMEDKAVNLRKRERKEEKEAEAIVELM